MILHFWIDMSDAPFNPIFTDRMQENGVFSQYDIVWILANKTASANIS